MALSLLAYGHFSVLRNVSMDKIVDCFRGRKYAMCDHYKEFYDPVSHKTAAPFEVDVPVLEQNIYQTQRDDFDLSAWAYKWNGKKTEQPGKVYIENHDFGEIKLKSPSDTSRIVEEQVGEKIVKNKSDDTITKPDKVKINNPII